MLHSLHESVAKAMGVEKLDTFQAQSIGQAYVNWLRSNEELRQRYAMGDPALSNEFVSLWSRGFIDPMRRAQLPAAHHGHAVANAH